MLYEKENVDLYERTTTIKSNGAESLAWNKVDTVFCNIQADGKFGDNLVASESGDKLRAFYNMYTQYPIKNGQRIYRDDQFYEIRNVEHNGRGTILEHYKGYLERVENQ